jgi:hypothetical protein
VRTGSAAANGRIDPRTAAQRAFFDQALGQQTAQPQRTAAASGQTPAIAVTRVETLRDTSEAARPTRILRPGSLLDIKV